MFHDDKLTASCYAAAGQRVLFIKLIALAYADSQCMLCLLLADAATAARARLLTVSQTWRRLAARARAHLIAAVTVRPTAAVTGPLIVAVIALLIVAVTGPLIVAVTALLIAAATVHQAGDARQIGRFA